MWKKSDLILSPSTFLLFPLESERFRGLGPGNSLNFSGYFLIFTLFLHDACVAAGNQRGDICQDARHNQSARRGQKFRFPNG